MATTRKILKVFLASPGDLADERQAAKFVVDEFNALLADEFGYHVELVGWEDTVSVFGRPQETINKELARCELFIGILWKHWGTPPSKDGPYTSGFEEEFRTTVQRREGTGRPEISLFLKNIAPEYTRDPGDQLKKVLKFREELIAEKKILYEAFDDVRAFETGVRRLITSYVRRRIAEEQDDEQRAASSDQEQNQEPQTQQGAAIGALAEESAGFLLELLETKDAAHKPISATDVARLRLISLTTQTSSNDDVELGTHDANLLYLDPNSAGFAYREKSHLFSCGLHHFANENAPLWKWYAAMDGFRTNILPLYTASGNESVRIGAFGAMREIGASIDVEMFGRHDFISSWFSSDAPAAVRSAALGYLADYGRPEDADAIQEEFSRSDGGTSAAAIEALLRIALRESRVRAASTLIELQPTTVPDQLLREIFAADAILPSELIAESLRHQNALVRYYALRNQRDSSTIDDSVRAALLSDSSAAVRAEALIQLIRSGRSFSLDDATRIVAPEPGSKSLLRTAENRLAEAAWHECQQQRFASADISAENFPALSFFRTDAFFALVERQFTQHKAGLAELIKTQFARTFEEEVQRTRELLGANSEHERQLASLSQFVCRRLTRQALDLLTRKGDRSDLQLVRDTIRQNHVDYSIHDADFFRLHGEFADISLLIEAVERPLTGRDGMIDWERPGLKFDAAAKAIVHLAKNRLAEVLAMPAVADLVSRIVAHSSEKTFKALSDSLILQLFSSAEDEVRKAVAIKCVKTLPKKRNQALLAAYTAPDKHRYYNVVRWLDLVISAPREVSIAAASHILIRRWTGH